MAVVENFFETREQLFAALTDFCAAKLNAATAQGQASFMVSGGSSPAPVYEALSKADLAWDKIQVALVDERWVEPGHDKSNQSLLERTLIQNNAANASFTAMKNSGAVAADGLAECEADYQKLAQPLTLTMLGMGPDGHTASLFPHAKGLAEALSTDALCAAITANESEVTGAFVERMTLTASALNAPEELVLLITGDDKLEALRAAQAEGAVEDMPIRAVLNRENTPLQVFWAP